MDIGARDGHVRGDDEIRIITNSTCPSPAAWYSILNRYTLRRHLTAGDGHGGIKKSPPDKGQAFPYARRDSNPKPSDPKSDALSS
jgi:hypothetical protein